MTLNFLKGNATKNGIFIHSFSLAFSDSWSDFSLYTSDKWEHFGEFGFHSFHILSLVEKSVGIQMMICLSFRRRRFEKSCIEWDPCRIEASSTSEVDQIKSVKSLGIAEESEETVVDVELELNERSGAPRQWFAEQH